MERLRVGIIDCGAVTEVHHLPACQKVRDVEVVWAVDLSEERANAFARRSNIPKVATDYWVVLEDVDAVIPAGGCDGAVQDNRALT